MDPHIFAQGNKEYPDNKYAKLKICILKLILDSYECIPVARVTMNCVILP